MEFLTNGKQPQADVTGLFGVTLSRPLQGDEKVELRDQYGRLIHNFLSASAQELEEEDPETTGKAIMLTTKRTWVTVTDHSGDKLIVTFSHNHV